MSKHEIIDKLINECVEKAPSGVWYVTPRWRESECLYGYTGDYAELLEVLKLTVDKKNAIDNQINRVLEWLYKLMTETVDTKLNEAEIDLLNGALAYLAADNNGTKPQVNIDSWNFAKRS